MTTENVVPAAVPPGTIVVAALPGYEDVPVVHLSLACDAVFFLDAGEPGPETSWVDLPDQVIHRSGAPGSVGTTVYFDLVPAPAALAGGHHRVVGTPVSSLTSAGAAHIAGGHHRVVSLST